MSGISAAPGAGRGGLLCEVGLSMAFVAGVTAGVVRLLKSGMLQ